MCDPEGRKKTPRAGGRGVGAYFPGKLLYSHFSQISGQ